MCFAFLQQMTEAMATLLKNNYEALVGYVLSLLLL